LVGLAISDLAMTGIFRLVREPLLHRKMSIEGDNKEKPYSSFGTFGQAFHPSNLVVNNNHYYEMQLKYYKAGCKYFTLNMNLVDLQVKQYSNQKEFSSHIQPLHLFNILSLLPRSHG
jgi:hypothetical protein